MALDDYFAAQATNLEQIRRLPHFAQLMPRIDRLYELGSDLVPRDSPAHFGRFLLLAHKSFVSAAALVGRAQPEDAAGVTRRAIEIARIARAIKYDAANFDRWNAWEARLARWRARQENERPRPLHTEIVWPPNHSGMEWLGRELGILSDEAVHFTPEYILQRDWHVREHDGVVSLFLQYFEPDQRVLERSLILLAGIHAMILDLFDECYDGALSAARQWNALRSELQVEGYRLSHTFASPEARTEALGEVDL